MDEKRKPFATIHIRRPRVRQITAVILFILIAAVAGLFAMQEYESWQARMRETELLLQERTTESNEAQFGLQVVEMELQLAESKLHETETLLRDTEGILKDMENRLEGTEATLKATQAQLRDVQNRLKQVPPLWQVHEPLAFQVDASDSFGRGHIMRALACSRMPQGYESYVYLGSQETEVVENLIASGEYTLVGKRKWSKGWTYGDNYNEDYYMRTEVFDVYPFSWSESKVWTLNEFGWYDHVHSYCNDTVSPLEVGQE